MKFCFSCDFAAGVSTPAFLLGKLLFSPNDSYSKEALRGAGWSSGNGGVGGCGFPFHGGDRAGL